jgi:hypothetical protein
LNLKRYIALLLLFAVSLTIARPYFVKNTAFSDVNSFIVQQQEKGSFFSKLVWQLENSNELEEDVEDEDSETKNFTLQSSFLNRPFSYQFNKSNTTQITLLLKSRKQLSLFSRLFILFENLRN